MHVCTADRQRHPRLCRQSYTYTTVMVLLWFNRILFRATKIRTVIAHRMSQFFWGAATFLVGASRLSSHVRLIPGRYLSTSTSHLPLQWRKLGERNCLYRVKLLAMHRAVSHWHTVSSCLVRSRSFRTITSAISLLDHGPATSQPHLSQNAPRWSLWYRRRAQKS